MPTYEPSPTHLKAAIESVLAQTETRWEMLIHDDASTIDVRAIVEPYLKDPRITFARSENRLGIGGNWNESLKMCHGERSRTTTPYIQLLFQDDTWHPHYLERALGILEAHPDIDFVSAAHEYRYEEGMKNNAVYEEVQRARSALQPGRHDGKEFLRMWIERELRPNLIGEPSFVMLRQSLMEQTGSFDTTMQQCLDTDMWLRCLLHGNIYILQESLGSFRVHPRGASARNEELGAGIYDRLRCFNHLIKVLPAGELKHIAVRARSKALVKMGVKFLKRFIQNFS